MSERSCETCGALFQPFIASAGKFCSRKCYIGRTLRDPITTFHASYIPEPNSGCFLWEGPYHNTGYGQFNANRKNGLAHRFALQIDSGLSGEGLHACHRCDNPACVNPAHLFWGTPADNMRDAREKGRTRGAPRQTHCGRGHEYTPETTLVVLNHGYPERQCRICNRERALRNYHKDGDKSRAAQNERNRRKRETGVSQ
jgi:hypothetical protein